MKLPEKPIAWERLLGDLLQDKQQGFETYGEILRQIKAPVFHGRYLHWDDVRYRPLPPGLTAELVWLGLKYRRSAAARYLPMKDQADLPFQYGMVDPVVELLHFVDQNAAGRIEMPDSVLNPQTRDSYLVSSLIEEAIRSSQLEGAATTRAVAQEMLRTGRPPADRDERMILNNYRTMQYVREIKPQPLTLDLLCAIQRMITDQTLERPEAAGRFRRPDEPVGVYDNRDNTLLFAPPPADSLPKRVQLWCDFANAKIPDFFIHPVVRAIILHFGLAYEHPFVDGNGRTARALFYWLMLKQGYWLCEFLSISSVLRKAPAQYARSYLLTETDENDLNYFIIHQLGVIRQAIRDLHDHIQRKTVELQAMENTSRVLVELNHRQKNLMLHALRHPAADYTIESHRTSHATVYETARRDLLDLVKRGLLQTIKVGRALHFRPAPDLSEKLADHKNGHARPHKR